MRLLLSKPNLAGLSCDHCIKWLVSVETGEDELDGNGDAIRRPTGFRAPCHKCAKCDGQDSKTPEAGRKSELSERNFSTIRMYMQCKASGGRCIPEWQLQDAILARNLGTIEWLIDGHQRNLTKTLLEMMAARSV